MARAFCVTTNKMVLGMSILQVCIPSTDGDVFSRILVGVVATAAAAAVGIVVEGVSIGCRRFCRINEMKRTADDPAGWSWSSVVELQQEFVQA